MSRVSAMGLAGPGRPGAGAGAAPGRRRCRSARGACIVGRARHPCSAKPAAGTPPRHRRSCPAPTTPCRAAHPSALLSSRPPLQALAKLFDPLVAFLAPRYQAVVGHELRKYGLRYEDLYDPQYDLVRGSVCVGRCGWVRAQAWVCMSAI